MNFIQIDGLRVPLFLYGTAWKEEETNQLTTLALTQGFRGIDTANQRRHYFEAAVGEALANFTENGTISRDEIFLQTKFTFLRGQDHRLPYDKNASIRDQVMQSFSSSLEHLRTKYIDSYLLHGPSTNSGLTANDWEAWRAMEALKDSGLVRFLGISNVNVYQLQELYKNARIPPRFVQNRCYASLSWDAQVRKFCISNKIHYQGFSLLTANKDAINHPYAIEIASKYRRTVNQIIFRFALEIGMIPLTGTSNAKHMQEDLSIFDFQLTSDEIKKLEILQ